MTTEQAELRVRRHLLETANDRPADGALDAVLTRTAAARQQPRWLARTSAIRQDVLAAGGTWLRFAAVAVVLALALVGVALLAGSGGPSNPFEGTWTSIDPADDSVQTLVVGAGLQPQVHFEDAFSINCQRQGDSSTLYLADGVGQLEGTLLTVQFPSGGCVTWRVPEFEWWYDLDPTAGTLTDYAGITWERLPDERP